MFKSIFIPAVISLLALFSFFAGEVTLDLNLPDTANAGDEFLVEVIINKGDIEGFARFQQELPVGFTAEARQTANGEFKFEDQKIKIQWMRVPLDREFTISYAVQVAPTVAGDFNFAGKFSYILNNAVQNAEITPKAITIIGDESATGLVSDASTTYTYQNVSLKQIDCIRQKPYLNENNEVIVNLLINKGDLTDFGKIQEQIPRGYNAISIKSKNSIFTFKNQIIKFLWMQMPREPQFVVSYKLVPEGEIPDQAFLISGTFSYAENERTKTIDIAERNVDLAKFTGEELVAQNAETASEKPEETPVETTPDPEPVETTTTQTTTDVETTNRDNLAETNYNEPAEPEPAYTDYSNTSIETEVTEASDIPSPEYGIKYRVQVAAGHRLVSKNYFKRLNITDEVQIEIHEGWHKYTVGNFNMYRDARDYRIYVWNNTPIHDAFVAAYNNGMRITVQEALMIANQKWYK